MTDNTKLIDIRMIGKGWPQRHDKTTDGYALPRVSQQLSKTWTKYLRSTGSREFIRTFTLTLTTETFGSVGRVTRPILRCCRDSTQDNLSTTITKHCTWSARWEVRLVPRWPFEWVSMMPVLHTDDPAQITTVCLLLPCSHLQQVLWS